MRWRFFSHWAVSNDQVVDGHQPTKVRNPTKLSAAADVSRRTAGTENGVGIALRLARG